MDTEIIRRARQTRKFEKLGLTAVGLGLLALALTRMAPWLVQIAEVMRPIPGY